MCAWEKEKEEEEGKKCKEQHVTSSVYLSLSFSLSSSFVVFHYKISAIYLCVSCHVFLAAVFVNYI